MKLILLCLYVCKVFLLEMWAGKNVNLERSNTSQSRQLSFQKCLKPSSPLLCYRLRLEPWGSGQRHCLRCGVVPWGLRGERSPRGVSSWRAKVKEMAHCPEEAEFNCQISVDIENQEKTVKNPVWFFLCVFFPCMFFGRLIQCFYSGKNFSSEKSHRAPLPPFEGYLMEFIVVSVERCPGRWD